MATIAMFKFIRDKKITAVASTHKARTTNLITPIVDSRYD